MKDIKDRNGKIIHWTLASEDKDISDEQLVEIYNRMIQKYIAPEIPGTLKHIQTERHLFGTVHQMSYMLPDSSTCATNTEKVA